MNYRQFLGRFLGFQIGISPGIHANIVSDVYKENRRGELVQRALHADLYFAPKLSVGTFLSNRSKSHQIFGIFHFISYVKYNSSFLPSVSYEISYTF